MLTRQFPERSAKTGSWSFDWDLLAELQAHAKNALELGSYGIPPAHHGAGDRVPRRKVGVVNVSSASHEPDPDPSNNRRTNLRWDTHKRNIKDQEDTPTSARRDTTSRMARDRTRVAALAKDLAAQGPEARDRCGTPHTPAKPTRTCLQCGGPTPAKRNAAARFCSPACGQRYRAEHRPPSPR